MKVTRAKKEHHNAMSIIGWPGGKSNAINCLTKAWNKHFADSTEIISPFFGGGSFELALLQDPTSKVRKLTVNDIDKRLIKFWKYVKIHRASFLRSINRLPKVTRARFLKSRALLTDNTRLTAAQSALEFWIINRCSFGALGLSGGYAETMADRLIRRRPNTKVKDIDLSKVSFTSKDWEKFLTRRQGSRSTLFLDPPYHFGARQVNMYGKYGDLQNGFDHERLRQALGKRTGWMLCYNNTPVVRKLYSGYIQIPCRWSYSMTATSKANGSSGRKTELIIVCPH